MKKKESTDGKEEEEGLRRVRKVLNLSDAEFEKWLDKVERAGLKLKASS